MNPEGILFLDIETVSQKAHFDELDEKWQGLWKIKCKHLQSLDQSKSIKELYEERAGIFSEFGKIVCIGLGFFNGTEFRTRSIAEENEKDTIEIFFDLVSKYFNNNSKNSFCGHNIREFDIPYILRRATILQIAIPEIFQISNKKPWEVKQIIDTLELWKFGDLKHYTSLNLLAACLDLPTSKDAMDGSEVGEYYWKKRDIESICIYCVKDVILTARVFIKMNQLTGYEAK